MLKWIAGAVLSAMGVAALAGPLTDAIKPDNAATKLVQAAGRANNRAGDLGSSYADIVPITDEEGNPTQQETPQTPDPRYEEYASQAEHEVRDAMTFLNELQEQSGPVRRTQYISAVRQLKAAWHPDTTAPPPTTRFSPTGYITRKRWRRSTSESRLTLPTTSPTQPSGVNPTSKTSANLRCTCNGGPRPRRRWNRLAASNRIWTT